MCNAYDVKTLINNQFTLCRFHKFYIKKIARTASQFV